MASPLQRIPRPLGLASPLGRVPRESPLPPLVDPLVDVVPRVDACGAGTRDWRFEAGVWYLDVRKEVGGFSTNEVSVVMNVASMSTSPAVRSGSLETSEFASVEASPTSVKWHILCCCSSSLNFIRRKDSAIGPYHTHPSHQPPSTHPLQDYGPPPQENQHKTHSCSGRTESSQSSR